MASEVKLKIKATDQTRRAFKSANASIAGMGSSISRVGTSIGALVGVGGLGLLIKRTIDAGDQIQKLSIRLGVSTEALSQLRHVAELSGVSFETVTNGIKKLQKSASDAAVGLSTPKRAFEQLGIEVEQFKRLAPEDQFEVFADALNGIENQSDRTRIAMDVMGRAGSDLLTVMEGGSKSIREMRKEADEMGLTLSKAEADAMADFNDSLTRMNSRLTGLAQTVLPAFFNYLGEGADFLTNETIPAFKELAHWLGVIETNMQAKTESGLVESIRQIKVEISDLQSETSIGDTFWKMLGINPASTEDIEKIKELEASLALLEQRLQTLRGSQGGAGAPGAPTVAGGGLLASVSAAGGGEDRANIFTGLTQEQMDADFENAVSMGQEMVDGWKQQQEERVQNEKAAAQMVMNSRMATFHNGVALLQALSGRSKSHAIAAIALQKGLAIAQTIMSTTVGAAKAMELGPALGPPAAASIKAWGAVQVGLIAATGLVQAGNLGGGGASLGTPANPISTSPESAPQSTAPGTAGNTGTNGTINIIVNGVLTSEIVDDILVPAIRDGIDNRDVILINSNSRNAQELLPAWA